MVIKIVHVFPSSIPTFFMCIKYQRSIYNIIIKIIHIRLYNLCITPVLCDRTCHLWWRGCGHPTRDGNPSGVLRSGGCFSIQVVYFLDSLTRSSLVLTLIILETWPFLNLLRETIEKNSLKHLFEM